MIIPGSVCGRTVPSRICPDEIIYIMLQQYIRIGVPGKLGAKDNISSKMGT